MSLELTSIQEDLILEQNREHENEINDGRQETFYADWLSDNKASLEKEFCEDREEEFTEFCLNVFSEVVYD